MNETVSRSVFISCKTHDCIETLPELPMATWRVLYLAWFQPRFPTAQVVRLWKFCECRFWWYILSVSWKLHEPWHINSGINIFPTKNICNTSTIDKCWRSHVRQIYPCMPWRSWSRRRGPRMGALSTAPLYFPFYRCDLLFDFSQTSHSLSISRPKLKLEIDCFIIFYHILNP